MFDGEALVAVAETVMHPENRSLAAITGLAVKPDLRGRGYGGAVLAEILVLNGRLGKREHLAYIYKDNKLARQCFERSGFVPITPTPSEEGFLEFRLA